MEREYKLKVFEPQSVCARVCVFFCAGSCFGFTLC